MKKLFSASAVIAAAIMLSGCVGTPESRSSASSEPKSPLTVDLTPEYENGCITPPFWVVTAEETDAQIFLLGSMHAGKQDVKYPEYVLEAYRNSSYVAPEMDTVAFTGNIQLQRVCVGYLTLDGGTAADYIGDSYNETLDYFKKNGIYQSGMENTIPFYWASAASALVMERSGLESQYGTETIFLNLAYKDGKEIREIEGGESQYKMMGEIPMSVQLETLSQCVSDENIALQAEATEELYEAWSSFDDMYLSGLSVYKAEDVANPDDWQDYYDMMYTERQKLMTDFIIDSLEAGEQGFVFVGTLHYYAEPSVISLLKEAGYSVEPIRPERPVSETSETTAA